MKALLLCWILAFLPSLQARPAPKRPAEPVDLNTATATELMQLPGVGAKTAARILDYRRAHGPFQRPEELLSVKGIGEKAFLRWKEHLRAGTAP
jgi:competence protein ComEA